MTNNESLLSAIKAIKASEAAELAGDLDKAIREAENAIAGLHGWMLEVSREMVRRAMGRV